MASLPERKLSFANQTKISFHSLFYLFGLRYFIASIVLVASLLETFELFAVFLRAECLDAICLPAKEVEIDLYDSTLDD